MKIILCGQLITYDIYKLRNWEKIFKKIKSINKK